MYEEGDVTVLCNQAVHTDREVTANRPDIIIKNKKDKTVRRPAVTGTKPIFPSSALRDGAW